MTDSTSPAGAAGATSPAGATDPKRRGGPPIWFAVVAIGSMLVAVLLIAAQALGIGSGGSAEPPTMAPTGQAAARTHDMVVAALQGASFQVQDPQTPYRPGESAALVDVPRRLVQAILPSDPQGGYVVVYELPTNGDADRAGRDLVAYLASGPGAIGYPRDARFVLQRVGQTLVFFPWSPQASPDPRVAELAAALETVGTPVTR
jgi:hypothetical protein